MHIILRHSILSSKLFRASTASHLLSSDKSYDILRPLSPDDILVVIKLCICTGILRKNRTDKTDNNHITYKKFIYKALNQFQDEYWLHYRSMALTYRSAFSMEKFRLKYSGLRMSGYHVKLCLSL